MDLRDDNFERKFFFSVSLRLTVFVERICEKFLSFIYLLPYHFTTSWRPHIFIYPSYLSTLIYQFCFPGPLTGNLYPKGQTQISNLSQNQIEEDSP